MRSSFDIGRIAGIRIGVHYSWLFVFFLITWSLAMGFFPRVVGGLNPGTYWLMGIIAALALFASVLIHELSHSLVAQSRGLPVEGITLFIFGGVSNIQREADDPGDEFVVSVVGPLTSLVLAAVFFVISRLGLDLGRPVLAVVEYLALINLLLALFNLIPGYPLDGGRVLRSAIWKVTGSLQRATAIAATIGAGIGYLFILGGLYLAFFTGDFLGGIWIAFIGWFLSNAAQSSAQQTALQSRFANVTVQQAMTPDPLVVDPEVPLDETVHDYMLQRNVRCLPVVDHGRLVGTITLSDVRGVPRDRWPQVTVREVMGGQQNLLTVAPRDPVQKAVQILAEHDLHQLPVVESGRVVGVISRSDVMRYLTLRDELGVDNRKAPDTRRAA